MRQISLAFDSQAQVLRLTELLANTKEKRYTVGQLRKIGYTMAEILFLLKKGLCKLQAM
jgi:hypothetical protein